MTLTLLLRGSFCGRTVWRGQSPPPSHFGLPEGGAVRLGCVCASVFTFPFVSEGRCLYIIAFLTRLLRSFCLFFLSFPRTRLLRASSVSPVSVIHDPLDPSFSAIGGDIEAGQTYVSHYKRAHCESSVAAERLDAAGVGGSNPELYCWV